MTVVDRTDDERLDVIEAALAAMMRGEYEGRIPAGDGDTVLDAIAVGLNLLADEIRHTTVSKEFLESVVEAMGDGLVVVSGDGRIEKVNRVMLELTGRNEEELLGKTVDFVFALSAECRARPATQDFDDAVPIEASSEVVHRNGGPIPVAVRITHFGAETDRPRRAVIVVRDLRLLREKLGIEADIEARAVKMQLREATKLAAVGQLAAGVAHELNNPLTSVVSFAEFLLRDLAPNAEPARDATTRWLGYAEKIRGAAERCRAIVQDLLDFARPGTVAFVAVDLGAVVSRVVSIVANQLKVQETTLSVAMPDGLVIDGTPNRVEQVLLNLILNAAQALERGGEIRVTAERLEKTIRLSVADTGPGIPGEHLGRLFEPFFTTKPVGQGTGLGLAVSWGIMKDHGGEIQVESAPGKGTCFTMVFPRAGGGQNEGQK